MKTTLLEQIRKRREALGLKIQDMPLRAGLTRQQYGKIEAGGNPRLSSLDQIAEGLDTVLLLVPKSRLASVERLLANEPSTDADTGYGKQPATHEAQGLMVNEDHESPWGDI